MLGSNTGRHLIALVGALLMSTIAVGSAVAPAASPNGAVAANA